MKTIRKRDGKTLQPYDVNKIRAAVNGAWREVKGRLSEAPSSLITGIEERLTDISSLSLDVETIQDVVELTLMRAGHFVVAKAYILYRQKRAEARVARTRQPDLLAVSDYIHASKYARYRPELGRREVYAETVKRAEEMHLARFPQLEADIRWAFDLVRDKRVLPSMRSMQFAGPAVLANHCRLYNCSFSLVDRWEVFGEAMFLLLSGCGVGYSVQFEHVEKLEPVGRVDRRWVRHHVVEDSIEGWARAVTSLVRSYQLGNHLEFSYHEIRDAGSPLKTSGGRAPGHLKLKESLERVRSVLDGAQGRRLRPIECHRIMCHVADAVLSGGIRRSAMISLFSLDDSEMMYCKTGDWFSRDPWFANANNSASMKRSEVTRRQFHRLFEMSKEWGEPGVFFTENHDWGVNPCGEVSLNPKLGDETGWAFCNLTEINAAKMTSCEDFLECAKAASLIGTLQASYTDMPFLGRVSEEITRRDALLGVGMTGMLDRPDIACDPILQRAAAEEVLRWNLHYAGLIGIRTAARATLVKPSGTTSLELGCVGSGIHPHHARRYIRRVIADDLEVVFQEFRRVNPHMCVRMPDGKWVVEFPVAAPEGATLRGDLGAVDFLKLVLSTQQNWVIPGAREFAHNVSNTVTVKPGEWESVESFVWEHRQWLGGVSLLPWSGDKDYAFAPREEVVTEADEARWNQLVAGYKPVDYAAMREEDDGTNLTGEAACAGGACEVK